VICQVEASSRFQRGGLAAGLPGQELQVGAVLVAGQRLPGGDVGIENLLDSCADAGVVTLAVHHLTARWTGSPGPYTAPPTVKT
jgi:hypothetical protein